MWAIGCFRGFTGAPGHSAVGLRFLEPRRWALTPSAVRAWSRSRRFDQARALLQEGPLKPRVRASAVSAATEGTQKPGRRRSKLARSPAWNQAIGCRSGCAAVPRIVVVGTAKSATAFGASRASQLNSLESRTGWHTFWRFFQLEKIFCIVACPFYRSPLGMG